MAVKGSGDGVEGCPTGHVPRRALGKVLMCPGWLQDWGRSPAPAASALAGWRESNASSPGQRLTTGDLGLTSGESSWLAATVC